MSIDVANAYDLDTTGTKDNSVALQKWATAAAAVTGPQPNYVFSTGIIAYSAWPMFLVPQRFTMSADGQCVLKCTGGGDAVTLTGGSDDSTWRTTIDGFTIVPYGGGRGLVTYHIHDSDINVSVPGTLNQNAAHIYFSVLSRFWLTIGNYYDAAKWMPPGASKASNGLVLDSWNGQVNGQTSKCAVYSPNISSCAGSGILINNGGMNDIWGGSSEGNGNGFYIATGGHNIAHSVDFESNSNQDVTFASNNYNGLDCCTTQKAPQLGGIFSTNWSSSK
jgi:hypothetical protein